MEANTRRMLWRCRRGLLELDIVLQNFIHSRYETLDKQQLTVLEELLDYPDNDLWDLVTARTETTNASQHTMLTMLRNIQAGNGSERAL